MLLNNVSLMYIILTLVVDERYIFNYSFFFLFTKYDTKQELNDIQIILKRSIVHEHGINRM